VRIVVQVCTRAGHPVDETVLDERDERRNAESGGRERAGQADADGDVVLQHTPRE
jgi:hypothetical protein